VGVKKYKYKAIPGHPLAGKHNWVFIHRAVLYEKIGPGEHRCVWCGVAINWRTGGGRGAFKGDLVVDHLDRDIHNNSPENLVPSCGPCNSLRSSKGRIADGDLVVFISGQKIRAVRFICQSCGKESIGQLRGVNKYCSRRCASMERRPEHSCYREFACLCCGREHKGVFSKRKKFCDAQCYESYRWDTRGRAALKNSKVA